LLSALLDDELPEDQASALRKHLESCAGCREERGAIRRLSELLAAQTEPDPHFVARFRARRDADSSPLPWPWRTLALRLLPLSLAAILGAGVAVWMSVDRVELAELEARALAPGNGADVDPVLQIPIEPFAGQEP
jgi:anti-sigma factor RsiW